MIVRYKLKESFIAETWKNENKRGRKIEIKEGFLFKTGNWSGCESVLTNKGEWICDTDCKEFFEMFEVITLDFWKNIFEKLYKYGMVMAWNNKRAIPYHENISGLKLFIDNKEIISIANNNLADCSKDTFDVSPDLYYIDKENKKIELGYCDLEEKTLINFLSKFIKAEKKRLKTEVKKLEDKNIIILDEPNINIDSENFVKEEKE